MRSDELRKAKIAVFADGLKKDIAGGLLYGDLIDMDDPNSLIVAAYFYGMAAVRKENEAERMRLYMMGVGNEH